MSIAGFESGPQVQVKKPSYFWVVAVSLAGVLAGTTIAVVVPTFEPIFSKMGTQLPKMTQLMINASQMFLGQALIALVPMLIAKEFIPFNARAKNAVNIGATVLFLGIFVLVCVGFFMPMNRM
ncbi:MAG: hypothetical protein ABFD92_02775 [Planctomycetaceae bacterium]|nr:hypothetical protein [Planctomycetaceae bacterium]